MHWPQPDTYLDCWKQMEQLYKEGYAKAIGVCNFKEHHFDQLMRIAEIKPMVCQIESHPLFPQNNMLSYCKENNIQMMAYTPTGRMDARIKSSESMKKISAKYQKNIAQVILRWHYQRGVIPVVNTTSIEHLKDNMDIFDFSLQPDEMKMIDMMNINCRLVTGQINSNEHHRQEAIKSSQHIKITPITPKVFFKKSTITHHSIRSINTPIIQPIIQPIITSP